MNLRHFLYRIILFAGQIIIFSISVYATMLVISYQTEKRYSEALIDPPGHFPVLITRNNSLPNTKHHIEVLEWEQYQANLKKKNQSSTPVTTENGDVIALERNITQFSTRVIDGNPVVDIEEHTERATIFWRYRVEDGLVLPISRRAIGYTAAVFGVFPGLFFAWLIGRLSAGLVKKKNKD